MHLSVAWGWFEVIDIPEIERYERPDVAQSLDVETEGFLPGFTVTIPEVLELRRKYDLLELLLLDGEEKTLLWECAGDDLDELVKDKLVEFHIDRVEVLYGLMLEIQGWTTDQRGNVEVTVHKENTELLDCKITRGRRPDVVERRHLDDDYKKSGDRIQYFSSFSGNSGESYRTSFLWRFHNKDL